MNMFDSHLHLNDEHILPIVDEVIQRAIEAGVSPLLCAGYDIPSSRKAVELASKYKDVYAFVGIHPENREGLTLDVLKEIEELAKSPKVVAIGEIGLDYHWYKEESDHEDQKKWFIAQIEMANRLGLPVCIHARDAYAHTYTILKEHPIQKGCVLHCYSGSAEMMKEFVKLGCYFGFDGPVTYKNAVEPKKCASLCPSDRLLVETDSPYLTPVPFRGHPNEPKNIPYIVQTIAELRGVSIEELTEQMNQNLERLFHVKHE